MSRNLGRMGMANKVTVAEARALPADWRWAASYDYGYGLPLEEALLRAGPNERLWAWSPLKGPALESLATETADAITSLIENDPTPRIAAFSTYIKSGGLGSLTPDFRKELLRLLKAELESPLYDVYETAGTYIDGEKDELRPSGAEPRDG